MPGPGYLFYTKAHPSTPTGDCNQSLWYGSGMLWMILVEKHAPRRLINSPFTQVVDR